MFGLHAPGADGLVLEWLQLRLHVAYVVSSAAALRTHGPAAVGGGMSDSDASLTAAELLRLAREGSAAERAHAAADPRLPLEGLWLLARDTDPGVRGAVVVNPEVPAAVLEAIAAADVDLREKAGTHPNAPLRLMESVPLIWHTQWSLVRYAERQGASEHPRDELLSAWSRAHARSDWTTTLGQTWSAITGRRQEEPS